MYPVSAWHFAHLGGEQRWAARDLDVRTNGGGGGGGGTPDCRRFWRDSLLLRAGENVTKGRAIGGVVAVSAPTALDGPCRLRLQTGQVY